MSASHKQKHDNQTKHGPKSGHKNDHKNDNRNPTTIGPLVNGPPRPAFVERYVRGRVSNTHPDHMMPATKIVFLVMDWGRIWNSMLRT